MDEGFILIHRKIIKEWEWYNNINDRLVWFHCLLSANWKDGWYNGIKIPRGSFVSGRKKLATEIGITEQQVRTSLDHLKSTNNITIKSYNKYSIITINNYDKYQLATNNITNNQPTINQQSTNNQPTSNHNIIKEINNNERNKRNKNNIYIVENDNDVYKKIIDYLNNRIGSNYKSSTRKTRDLIKARLNENFTIDDFKIVIDKMCVEWYNDSKMNKYLRPETLFGTKFESYLNREVKQTTKNMTLSSDDIKDLLG